MVSGFRSVSATLLEKIAKKRYGIDKNNDKQAGGV
jgi:hypothetical protein